MLKDGRLLRGLKGKLGILVGIGLILALPSFSCSGGSKVDDPIAPPPVVSSPLRLILNGGAVPTANTVVANKASLEQSPFDGLIFALQAGRLAFLTTSFSASALAADKINLPLINSKRLTDNFLLIRGGVDTAFDRSSDAHWAIAQTNVRTFAQMAKLGNLKGIAFDPEAYVNLGQKSLFDYRTYDQGLFTFKACQANVRLRGQQVMKAIQEEYPGSTLFLFGGLCLLRNGTTSFYASSTFPTHPYGLLPDFINGMLDVLAPGMTLIDGGEASYTFYRSTWYANLKNLVQTTGLNLIDAGNQSKYRNQMEVCLTIYQDASFDQLNQTGLLAHWLSASDRPAFFTYQVYWAWEQTSHYVSIYSEKTDWVSRSGIPAGSEAAMVDAKVKVSGSLPLGIDIEPKIQAAAALGGLEW